MFSSAEEVLRFIAEENVEFVDVRFTDLPGTVQHFTVPVQTFDADVFTEFLSAQSDLGTKWVPRFVRVTAAIPVLGNGKIDKKPLRRDAWLCDDTVWWRPSRSAGYVRMTNADRDALREEFFAHDRIDAYPTVEP